MTPQELIQIRAELGMTQEELANLIGCGRTAVTNWENLNGKYPIHAKWEGQIRKIHAERGREWTQKLLDENRRLFAEVTRLEGIIDRMAKILAKPLAWKRLNHRQKKFISQGFDTYDKRIGKGVLRHYLKGGN